MTQIESIESLMERLAADPEQPAKVLHAVTGLLRVSDKELAQRTGWSRPTAHGKRTGSVKIGHADLLVLAMALDVPVSFFFQRTSEALRQTIDRHPDLFGWCAA